MRQPSGFLNYWPALLTNSALALAAESVTVDVIRQPFLVVTNNTVLGKSFSVSITAAKVTLTQDKREWWWSAVFVCVCLQSTIPLLRDIDFQ